MRALCNIVGQVHNLAAAPARSCPAPPSPREETSPVRRLVPPAVKTQNRRLHPRSWHRRPADRVARAHRATSPGHAQQSSNPRPEGSSNSIREPPDQVSHPLVSGESVVQGILATVLTAFALVLPPERGSRKPNSSVRRYPSEVTDETHDVPHESVCLNVGAGR